jgi:hypothetical protein
MLRHEGQTVVNLDSREQAEALIQNRFISLKRDCRVWMVGGQTSRSLPSYSVLLTGRQPADTPQCDCQSFSEFTVDTNS